MPAASLRKLLRYPKRGARSATRAIQKIQGKEFVHLLHIGKTGGSAVKYAIRGQYSVPSNSDRYVINRSVTNQRYVVCLRRHNVTFRDIPRGERVAFFVRDPIDRFVSGFYGRQRQDQPKYFVPWTPDEKIAFEIFATPNALASALSSPDVDEKASAERAMRSIEHVRSSYWEWFESEEYVRSRSSDVFFIGFQERLREDFAILKTKLGLPERIELPADEVQAHVSPKDVDRTLDDDAVRNLRRWYERDFEFISLCRSLVEERALNAALPAGG